MVRTTLASLGLVALAALQGGAARAANCGGTSTGLVPLTDLGAGLHQGYTGGLYPGGQNPRPAAHEAAGLALAGAIAPLDTLGNPDPNGRIVLISIGMSNATQEFNRFVAQAMTYPVRHPRLLVVDCAQGGQTASLIRNPAAPYWSFVAARLRQFGSAPAQVQAVWLKEANAGPTSGFPAAMEALKADLAADVRVLRQKLPNAKLCYLSSRTYGGYASTALNPEPYAYESGFAVQGLIAQQLAGVDSLNFDPDSGAVVAPWLSWGPYLWADGLTGRSDGLIWHCPEFLATDGTHPSEAGREKVADSLFTFFATDATTTPWFLGGSTAAVGGANGSLDFAATPNPARGRIEMSFATRAGEPWRIVVLDAAGRRIAEAGRGIGGGGRERRSWDGIGSRGQAAPPGSYWLRLTRGGVETSRRVAWLER